MIASCITHVGCVIKFVGFKKYNLCPCCPNLHTQMGIGNLLASLSLKPTFILLRLKKQWGHDVQEVFRYTLTTFNSRERVLFNYQYRQYLFPVWEVFLSSPNSILVYLCRSAGHVSWPQLSDWCVILDRELCCALYSVFRHSGDSSVSCQYSGLWDSIVQMLLS